MTAFSINGNLDSLLRVYSAGSHVELDRAVADVRSIIAEQEAIANEVLADSLALLEARHEQEELGFLTVQSEHIARRARQLVVRSPIDGVIATDRLHELVGAAVRAGDVLLEVADTSSWTAVLTVSERDIRDVTIGDTALLKLIALRREPVHELHGVVSYVSATKAVVASERATGGYTVRVLVAPEELKAIRSGALRSGYSVEANIVTVRGRIVDLVRARVNELRFK